MNIQDSETPRKGTPAAEIHSLDQLQVSQGYATTAQNERDRQLLLKKMSTETPAEEEKPLLPEEKSEKPVGRETQFSLRLVFTFLRIS